MTMYPHSEVRKSACRKPSILKTSQKKIKEVTLALRTHPLSEQARKTDAQQKNCLEASLVNELLQLTIPDIQVARLAIDAII
jgi:hypothetical protein